MSRSEAKFQIECVKAFKWFYPKEEKNLWSTRNTTFSKADGANQKKMGMLAGVSDLTYSSRKTLYLELKLPDSRHKAEHIQSQLDFGKARKEHDAEFYVCTTIEAFLYAIKHKPDSAEFSTFKGLYHIPDLEFMLAKETKTIQFY